MATTSRLMSFTWGPYYGSVRHPYCIARLPADEQSGWQAFWRDVHAKLAILRKEQAKK